MRILVNGYYYGGNCPQFVYRLKKLFPDTKVTNSLNALDYHGINYEFIDDNDIIDIRIYRTELFLIRILRKLKIPFWKKILTHKYKKLIDEFNPSIIINHKVSDKAEIMLKTGFRPQITYIYGGEIHAGKINSKGLDYVFANSTFIFTATKEVFDYTKENRPDISDRLRHFPLGAFDYEKVNRYKEISSVSRIRKVYNLPQDQTIFIDSRSLRSSYSGICSLLEAIEILSKSGKIFKVVFLRGYLGTDKMVQSLNEFIEKHSIVKQNIVIVDKILSNMEIQDYYYLSDAFLSLLPNDQFGSSIIDALFLDCKLILSDIEAYRNELGDGAIYIKNQDVDEIVEAFTQLLSSDIKDPDKETIMHIADKYNATSTYQRLYRFINEIIS